MFAFPPSDPNENRSGSEAVRPDSKRKKRKGACVLCHDSKVKCHWSPAEAKCERCKRLGKPCSPHISMQGRGRKRGKNANSSSASAPSVAGLASEEPDDEFHNSKPGKRTGRTNAASLANNAGSNARPSFSTQGRANASTARPNNSTYGPKAKTRGANKCTTYELKQPPENVLHRCQVQGTVTASLHQIASNSAESSRAQYATQSQPPIFLGQPNGLQALLHAAAAQVQNQNLSISNANAGSAPAAASRTASLQTNQQLASLINHIAQANGAQAASQWHSLLALFNNTANINTMSLFPNLAASNPTNSNFLFPQAQTNLMPAMQQPVSNPLDVLLGQIQQQNQEQEVQRRLQLLAQLVEEALRKERGM